MKNYHLTKGDDAWKLTGEGASRASLSAPTKAEALQKTHDFMAGKVGSVKIHKENGVFQEERTYPRAADPKKSPG